jgi:hypothetical protein
MKAGRPDMVESVRGEPGGPGSFYREANNIAKWPTTRTERCRAP